MMSRLPAHFKDRNDLLSRVLMFWRDAATAQVIQRFETSRVPPRELIEELISLPFRGQTAIDTASIELGIRAWARRDAAARKVVSEVDAQRLSYIAQCFSALGFCIADARHSAFMLYSCMVTESLLEDQGTPEQQAQRREYIKRMVLEARVG